MPVSLRIRHLGYRLAYRALGLAWTLLRFRPDGVKCVIVDGERLLLVRHTYGPRGWDLPGGGARNGEPPTETATREMAEELGLQVTQWRDLGALHSVNGSHRITLLGVELHEPPLRVDPIELADAAWFPRDALPSPTGPLLDRVLHSPGPTAFLADTDGSRS